MTQLSPSAQTIKQKIVNLYSDSRFKDTLWSFDLDTVVATLRAAALCTPDPKDCPEYTPEFWDGIGAFRAMLNATADELESSAPTINADPITQ